MSLPKLEAHGGQAVHAANPEELRDKCAEQCAAAAAELQACNERVSGRSNTTETCTQELFDFLHCRDACVAKSLFQHLK